MEVLYPRCAGLDVHKDSVVGCVRCVSAPEHREVRTFGTGSDETRSVAVADLNGDGVLDIVAGNIGEPNAVYLGLGDGRFAPQAVTIGRRGNGMVEILSGLKESEMIVSSATFLIDAESNLQAALDNLNPDASEAASAEASGDPDPHAGMDHSNHEGYAQ